ncbi:MAG: MFS transporter [Pasteurella sp.]|nr:MFS transporter [Pasteurella sp.]
MPKTLRNIVIYGLLFSALRMLVGATSAVYILSQGISLEELGYLKSFQFFLVLILDIPLSYIVDSSSRKLSIIVSAFFASFWLLITAFAMDLQIFYVAEFCNAISISLFNGAFLSYLVDIKNNFHQEIETKNVFAVFHKYDGLMMASSSFVGACFINTSSNITWIISGTLLFILPLIFIFILPKDNLRTKSTEFPLLIRFFQDIKLIFFHIKNNRILRYYILMLVFALVYMQTLIQIWQPILLIDSKNDKGVFYGIAFCLILLIQSFASYCIEKYSENNITTLKKLSVLLMLSPLVIFFDYLNYLSLNIFLLFAISFFSIKGMLIIISSEFHNHVPPEFRSTFEALTSVLSKLALIISFPLVMTGVQKYGISSLIYFLISLSMIFIFIQYYFAISVFKQEN